MTGTPTIGAAASAAWLEQLGLDASRAPQWYVEITIPTDDSDVRFKINIYPEEWGVMFRRGTRVSSIRVTDVPFIHGVDDDHLLPDLPALDRVGDLLANLERRFTLVFDLSRMRARSNFARATAIVRAWFNAQR